MGPAKLTILLKFDPVGMGLLILARSVVALLAVSASHNDINPHLSFLLIAKL